VFEGGGWSRN